MEHWEFLIQREGDRGWRPIETGNLQLMEGRYRIVANSNLIDNKIHTRVTHQILGPDVPQRKSQARNQVTNAKGLVAIIPFTDLQSGIWQFVCSGSNPDGSAWHRILKLKVLQRLEPVVKRSRPTPAHVEHIIDPMARSEDRDRFSADISPTAPLGPITPATESDRLVDELDQLLHQLEQDSLKPRLPLVTIIPSHPLQLTPISDPPLRLLSLDRSTFAGIMPGHRLTISGTCNLRLFSANFVQAVTITKLLICVRHPQTAEIITAIEIALPAQLDMFTFSGQVELPLSTTTSLLLGEVNLYDRHNIQVGSDGFTVTLELNPLPEAELSFLQLLDDHDEAQNLLSGELPETLQQQLTQELYREAAAIEPPFVPSNRDLMAPRATSIPTLELTPYPHIPVAYKRENMFAKQPEIKPVRQPSRYPNPAQPVTVDITGDLDLGIGDLHRDRPSRYGDTMEVVVDD